MQIMLLFGLSKGYDHETHEGSQSQRAGSNTTSDIQTCYAYNSGDTHPKLFIISIVAVAI